MNEQDTDITEEAILNKNDNFKVPVTEKNSESKKTKFFLKPKLIIIIICLFALLLIIVILFAMSQKPKTEISYDPNIVISSPESQNKKKIIDPDIQKDLDSFSKKVENLKSKQIDFTPPVIDYKSLSSF